MHLLLVSKIDNYVVETSEAAARGILYKKMFLKMLIVTGNHLFRSLYFNKVAGLKLEGCDFITEEISIQVFPCDFCEVFKTPFSQNISGWLLLELCIWICIIYGIRLLEQGNTCYNASNKTYNIWLMCWIFIRKLQQFDCKKWKRGSSFYFTTFLPQRTICNFRELKQARN